MSLPTSIQRRLLFVAAATLGLSTSWVSRAEACSPAPGPPGYAPAARLATPIASSPKNVGLRIDVYSGDLNEDEVRAKLAVEVRSGDMLIPGSLAAVSGTAVNRADGFKPWHWRPANGDLPVGQLDVRVTSTATEHSDIDTHVTISDRLFTTPSLPVHSVSVSRLVIDVEGAPEISCKLASTTHSSCGGTIDSQTTATLHRGVPQIGWQVTSPSQTDQAFLEQSVALYGRDAAGVIGTSDRRVYGDGVVTYLDGPYAQYCVELTTRSLIDGTETKDEKCVPHDSSLSLAISDVENDSMVRNRLKACQSESIQYPAGSSEDNPTGKVDSGCSVTPGSSGGSSASAIGLAIALVALRRRRMRA